MPDRILESIRECIREGRYDETDHAWDEMADDNLLLVDVETAILTGEIVRVDTDDPRGTVYVVERGWHRPGNPGSSRRQIQE